MSHYPAFLDLRGRAVLVVGGGDVARGKIEALLRAEARVQVVAPSVVEPIERLAERGAVTIVARPYGPQDVRGFQLVVAATDDAEVNRAVSADARRAGVLVNVVDSPELSTFIAPAVLTRGDLQLAVSTSGGSPAFAAFVRDRLAELIGPEYGVALTILRGVRNRLRSEALPLPERKRILRGLAEAGLVDRVRAGDRVAIDGLLESIVGRGSTLEALGVDLG